MESWMIKINIIFFQLMGGDEVYHYHAKVILKEAETGGTFAWHQDYGLVTVGLTNTPTVKSAVS